MQSSAAIVSSASPCVKKRPPRRASGRAPRSPRCSRSRSSLLGSTAGARSRTARAPTARMLATGPRRVDLVLEPRPEGRAAALLRGPGASRSPRRRRARRPRALRRPRARRSSSTAQRAGGGTQRPGDPLAVYEVAPLLRPGVNRLAIEAVEPDGDRRHPLRARPPGSGATPSSSRRPLARRPRSRGRSTGRGRYRPVVWGRPPMYPWGYPRDAGGAESSRRLGRAAGDAAISARWTSASSASRAARQCGLAPS